MKEIQNWLSDKELELIYTSSYWNDIEKEKKKEWWIEDGNYDRCLKYLDSSKLMFEYQQAEEFVKNFSRESIKVVDLASGIGWTSALLSKLSNVEEVHAVEISKHRLSILFEHSIKMLNGNESKISRYLGNFYDLKFQQSSIDIIFMSQAFHHANKPLNLLIECDRILKRDGRIIIVGEHFIGTKAIIKKFMITLIKTRKFITNFYQLFPPDQELGDHYYRQSDYYFMFRSMGYDIEHQQLQKGSMIYIADKKG